MQLSLVTSPLNRPPERGWGPCVLPYPQGFLAGLGKGVSQRARIQARQHREPWGRGLHSTVGRGQVQRSWGSSEPLRMSWTLSTLQHKWAGQ